MAGTHDYATCTDPKCGAFLCIACQYGYDLGHQDGMTAGYQQGFADAIASASGGKS